MKRHPAFLSLLAFATAANLQANLIVNPSFESGNVNFSSDYVYKSPGIPPDMDAGQYGVIQSLDQAHSAWADAGSLSAQSGTNYFVATGATSTEESPWYQTITPNPGGVTVTTDTNAPVYYRFQAYIASVYPGGAQPELAFEMSLNNSGAWQQLTTSIAPSPEQYDTWLLTYRDGYFLSAPTSISFRLRNTVTEGFGNDFAIDSLYFGLSTNAPAYDPVETPIDSIGAITGGVVPEPGTWAAAALLVGGTSFLRWRKRANHQ